MGLITNSSVLGEDIIGEHPKLQVVVQCIGKVFDSFEKFGYNLKEVRKSNSDLITYWYIVLHSAPADREIWFTYVPFDLEQHPVDLINVSVIKGEGDVSREFYMSFDVLLRNRCPSVDIQIFSVLEDSDVSFSEKIAKVLKAYAFYLIECAEDVISGKRWEPGLYDDFDYLR